MNIIRERQIHVGCGERILELLQKENTDEKCKQQYVH